MKVLTGDETGLLKVVNVQRKVVDTRCGEQTRAHAVAQVAWLPGGSSFAALSRAGTVEVWDAVLGKRVHTCRNAGEEAALLARRAGGFATVSAAGIVRLFDDAATDADTDGTQASEAMLSC